MLELNDPLHGGEEDTTLFDGTRGTNKNNNTLLEAPLWLCFRSFNIRANPTIKANSKKHVPLHVALLHSLPSHARPALRTVIQLAFA